MTLLLSLQLSHYNHAQWKLSEHAGSTKDMAVTEPDQIQGIILHITVKYVTRKMGISSYVKATQTL